MQATEIPIPSDWKAPPVIEVDPQLQADAAIHQFLAAMNKTGQKITASTLEALTAQLMANQPAPLVAASQLDQELRVVPYTHVRPQTTQEAPAINITPETEPGVSFDQGMSFDFIVKGSKIASRVNLENVALDLKSPFALCPEDVDPEILDYRSRVVGSKVNNMSNMFNVGAGANAPAPSSPKRTRARRVNIDIEDSEVGNMDNVRNSGNSTVAQAGFGKPPGTLFSRRK